MEQNNKKKRLKTQEIPSIKIAYQINDLHVYLPMGIHTTDYGVV